LFGVGPSGCKQKVTCTQGLRHGKSSILNRMPDKPSTASEPNPLSALMRELAAASSDPVERQSLLESAKSVDETDAKVQQAMSDNQEHVQRILTEIDQLKRQNDVPGWAVVTVLLAFALCLVYGALKHSV
jgi:flagellum-specific peptidoglycan hydrolase FlgJ